MELKERASQIAGEMAKVKEAILDYTRRERVEVTGKVKQMVPIATDMVVDELATSSQVSLHLVISAPLTIFLTIPYRSSKIFLQCLACEWNKHNPSKCGRN